GPRCPRVLSPPGPRLDPAEGPVQGSAGGVPRDVRSREALALVRGGAPVQPGLRPSGGRCPRGGGAYAGGVPEDGRRVRGGGREASGERADEGDPRGLEEVRGRVVPLPGRRQGAGG